MAQYWIANPWESSASELGDLRRRWDELFGGLPGRGTTARAGVYPPVNLYETPEGYVLTAELPGMRGDDIEITVEHDRLTLRGERRIEHPEQASLHRVERRAGAFRRTIQLPVEVEGDRVEAVYRNGVLTLRIPKAPEHRPRRISVKSQ